MSGYKSINHCMVHGIVITPPLLTHCPKGDECYDFDFSFLEHRTKKEGKIEHETAWIPIRVFRRKPMSIIHSSVVVGTSLMIVSGRLGYIYKEGNPMMGIILEAYSGDLVLL